MCTRMSAPSVKPTIHRHPHGISAIDAEYLYPGHAAAHLIEDSGSAAFVDVGTNDSVPYLLAALAELGIARAAVDYVLLTHVHLDHAGGAGRLMRELPNARAVLHPRGAPHMIDPSRLIAGSRAVYGEARFARLYGELIPLAPDRVHVPAAGELLTPSPVPTQFDPEQHLASIDRMVSYRPESIYLMHFSRVTGVPRLAGLLKAQIRELAAMARRHARAPDRAAAIRAEMLALWIELARREGSTLEDAALERALAGDLELNTQGLIAWLDRDTERKS